MPFGTRQIAAEPRDIRRRAPFPRTWPLGLLFFVGALSASFTASSEAVSEEAALFSPEQLERFEKTVRPILVERCGSCHTGEKIKAGLRLDGREHLLAGGDTGPAIVPGKPDESLLIAAVRYEPDGYQMPPAGKLPAAEIATLESWVAEGAPWPSAGPGAEPSPGGGPAADEASFQARRRHWSFQPLAAAQPPPVSDAAWVSTPVDAFILAGLDEAGLTPAARADRYTLLRRVTFDLTGLPPTPAEIAAFLADESPQAWSRVVERLLASPHYGERWARHWLDLVRYAETAGHEFDFDLPDAWRYRDYCVRAFNGDLSYFDLVREHLAGDLLDPPRRDPQTGNNESVIGTAFFYLGESKHSPVDLGADRVERVDNQIDVLSKTFLGLTLSCARCHDHKFDPLTQRDYYALAGILKSSHYQQAVISPPEPRRARADELAALQQAVDRLAQSPAGPAPPAMLAAPQAPDLLSLADFEQPELPGWTVSELAFGSGPTTRASARLDSAAGGPALAWTYPGTVDSGQIAEPLDGSLRSPTFTLERNWLWYRARGRGGRIRLILENFQRIQAPIYGDLAFSVSSPAAWQWHGQNVAMWRGMRGYLEVLDDGPGWVALDGVWMSDQPPSGSTEPAGAVPVAEELAAPLEELRAALAERLAEWAAPERTMAMIEGTPDDERIHIRGSHQRLGEVVPRRGPELLGGVALAEGAAGSGRRQLAELIAGRENPLTARVMVNRLWHHHFGAGLVRSVDDFGAMGQPPTHPALLDYLADRFLAQGGSLKALHRLILLSSTYQMSSQATPESRERDGDYRLWSRAKVRRLEAEAVRDALLAVSGRLDRTLGGPSVPPHLTEFMQGRGRPAASGPLDGHGRRTLYLGVRRNFLSPLLLAFDYPQPFSTMGRRSTSNVPAQALVLMNNPLVVEQAAVWAARLSSLDESRDARITRMYLEALGRPPRADEQAAAREFVEQAARQAAGASPQAAGVSSQATGGSPPATGVVPPARSPDQLAAWQALAQALLNLKEFVYLR